MISILFLADLNPNKFGSMEEMILFLGREISQRGNELILGVIEYPIPEVAKLFSSAGIKVIKIDATCVGKKNTTILQKILFFRRLIRDQKIDLVHINFYGLTNPVVIGAYLTCARIVYTEHASGVFSERGVINNWLSKFLHFFIALRINKYIAVSNFVRDRLRSSHHVGSDKTVTIYNGVNTDRFKSSDRISARKATGLPLNRKIVLSVAMLIPEKGIHCLINAAAILVNDLGVQDLCIVVAGEGYYQDTLEKLVQDLQISEHVMFLGRRSDVNLLVAAADVVTVPAIWAESFGLIIAEAMAGSRPVVASRVGGIPELIEDGQTGLLVQAGDSVGLAAAINSLLNDSKQRQYLVASALTKVCQQFDLSQQVTMLSDLYEGVVSADN